ncbi:pimeloyl-ACP methyl esterase BioG family protein [Paracoccus sulfuroxidans]|uniref:Biotin synthesis protein BioG n=1 Tax=Paracoccus sulfuroxidans TaxID=384678 RepID=A0A562NCR2_9RHOB|nr:pimeloyl-ACP methyl esterase BioG family protein [Paracoccus sulfuroxidans]TWI29880.1 biotin synthesis protein BioG [Paracoccus sulfuroxidans]
MRAQWLRRDGGRELTLVLSGWAVGAMPFAHLAGRGDVLLLDDYRDEALPLALIAPWRRFRLLAYSLGVGVAARIWGQIAPERSVAVCGTPFAAHETLGIAPEIYASTQAAVTPEGMARFARRAGCTLPPDLDFAALAQELDLLRGRQAPDIPPFDRIHAGKRDRIFTHAAMTAGWAGRPIDWHDSGHNPFPMWRSWDEVFA